MAVGKPKRLHVEQLFLVLDPLVVPAHEGFVESADRLVKYHFIFGVEYSPVLKNFWEFVVSAIYNILPAQETKASVRALALSLSKMELPSMTIDIIWQ